MNTKLCKRCGRVLPLSEFYRNRAKRDFVSTYCKECQRKEQSNYITNKKQNIMAKVSVKNGDLSLIRFMTGGFDLYLARIDGRKENRETIGKRYIISNAMLNKFADFMAEYFSNKGIENGCAVIPDDMVCFSEKAQEFVNDEKRRNKGRKAMERFLNIAEQLKEMGYSNDEIIKIINNDTIE